MCKVENPNSAQGRLSHHVVYICIFGQAPYYAVLRMTAVSGSGHQQQSGHSKLSSAQESKHKVPKVSLEGGSLDAAHPFMRLAE